MSQPLWTADRPTWPAHPEIGEGSGQRARVRRRRRAREHLGRSPSEPVRPRPRPPARQQRWRQAASHASALTKPGRGGVRTRGWYESDMCRKRNHHNSAGGGLAERLHSASPMTPPSSQRHVGVSHVVSPHAFHGPGRLLMDAERHARLIKHTARHAARRVFAQGASLDGNGGTPAGGLRFWSHRDRMESNAPSWELRTDLRLN